MYHVPTCRSPFVTTPAPNVFLSWSGTLSKEIATALREWLPDVVRDARPWLSAEDIGKGTVWPGEIQEALSHCKVGVCVLTRESLVSPWVLFEAGALYKAMNDSYVCTLVCDLEPPITGPLGVFQATVCNEEDMHTVSPRHRQGHRRDDGTLSDRQSIQNVLAFAGRSSASLNRGALCEQIHRTAKTQAGRVVAGDSFHRPAFAPEGRRGPPEAASAASTLLRDLSALPVTGIAAPGPIATQSI